ncbi:hypothetical protein LCGC14_2413700, partial [marine sediment metagenome]
KDLEELFNQITFDLHRKEYQYINIWKDILSSKFNEFLKEK